MNWAIAFSGIDWKQDGQTHRQMHINVPMSPVKFFVGDNNHSRYEENKARSTAMDSKAKNIKDEFTR